MLHIVSPRRVYECVVVGCIKQRHKSVFYIVEDDCHYLRHLNLDYSCSY